MSGASMTWSSTERSGVYELSTDGRGELRQGSIRVGEPETHRRE
jgi:hypothetical protein